MHVMLSLKKVSSPGRGGWDATLCKCVEDEKAALAPATADATERARAWCALSATTDASCAAFMACSISSSYRASCRIVVCLASSSSRWARFASDAKSEGPTRAPRTREGWEWRSVKREEPYYGQWHSIALGEASW